MTDMADIFLLTKPPGHHRAKLCFKLLKRSKDAVLYLCGDGVYCMFDGFDGLLPHERIYACKEDTDARGVQTEGAATVATVLVDFYEQLAKDMMIGSDKVYTF